MRKIRKGLQRFKDIYARWGTGGICSWANALVANAIETRQYQKSIQRSGVVPISVHEDENSPLLSIILPVFNVDENWLRKCLESVRSQIYQDWELCIADDASPAAHVRRILEEYASKDSRIRVVFRETNGHISAASNSALEFASGEFCVLLDHDDELSPDALLWVANEINEHPDVAMIYSDEDLIDENGRRSAPKFKPNFSRDLLYSLNLVTHLSAYRTDILRAIGGFRVGLEGSQDYDLALRVLEQIDETQIFHIPRILYHWRAIPGSVALDGDQKPYAHERARQVIREHFERTGVIATVEQTHFNLHRVRYPLPETPPKLSVICWSDCSERDVLSFDAEALDYPVAHIEVIQADRTSPLARSLNAAIQFASGEVILLIRQGVESISESPLADLVSFALQPSIGCVGGIVLGNDGTVQAGGIVLGGEEVANIAHAGIPEHMPGNMIRNLVISNFSAVCLDVFAIRREIFLESGGFDERFSDKDLLAADLCIEVGKAGARTILTPYAKFAYPRSHSRQKRIIALEERNRFRSKWGEAVKNDPFSNPNLSNNGRFSIKI